MGRPCKYEKRVKPYFKEIKAMLEKGLTEREVAKALNIAYSTYNDYKNKYPEFSELIKGKDMKPLIENLENALVKKALGFYYEEEKKYTTEDGNGKKKKSTEKFRRYSPPDTTAIFGALNRFDPDYKKDAAYYELKKQELELKKAIARENSFDLKIEDFEED